MNIYLTNNQYFYYKSTDYPIYNEEEIGIEPQSKLYYKVYPKKSEVEINNDIVKLKLDNSPKFSYINNDNEWSDKDYVYNIDSRSHKLILLFNRDDIKLDPTIDSTYKFSNEVKTIIYKNLIELQFPENITDQVKKYKIDVNASDLTITITCELKVSDSIPSITVI